MNSWQFWAGMSALFAALTAILAKVGVDNISPDFGTFYRTMVLMIGLGLLLLATGQLEIPKDASGKAYMFLTLSGLATGASWLCYFRALKIGNASQVAPVDKFSVVLVAIFGALFLGEKLTGANWAGVALIGIGAALISLK